ncbi:MAG: hypothetical protein Devi2KO_40410 [Devosia indica]
MSLNAQPVPPIPEHTRRIAHAAFPKGNPYLTLRDDIGPLFCDDDFADLFPPQGQHAYAPWRLALITLLQFRENLSDRQAASAVRARIDWKYLLSLELADAGFDFSILSEFRTRLLNGQAGQRLLDKVLERAQALDLLKSRGRQRTDSTHVLSAVRVLNRLELLGETLRAALNVLATVAPEWLRRRAPAEWYKRYGRRVEDGRLPRGTVKRTAYAEVIGADGFTLLSWLGADDAPEELRVLPAVQTLEQVWADHFDCKKATKASKSAIVATDVRLRAPSEPWNKAEAIKSPYDLDARYGNKGSVKWIGYRAHVTETCDEECPRLVTHVLTTAASTHDSKATPVIQEALVAQGRAPSTQLMDSVYLTATGMVESLKLHQIHMVGPAMRNTSWQERQADAFGLEQFSIDWEREQVQCPEGRVSKLWGAYETEQMGRFVRVKFDAAECQLCAVRSRCTKATKNGRQLTFKPREQHEALEAIRAYLQTKSGAREYGKRAGVEGTFSQLARVFGVRRARYRTEAKAHVQHVATAAALNVDRLVAWQQGRDLAKTRTSRFAALAA